MLVRASRHRIQTEAFSGGDGGFGGVNSGRSVTQPHLYKGRALQFWRFIPGGEPFSQSDRTGGNAEIIKIDRTIEGAEILDVNAKPLVLKLYLHFG